MPTKEVLETLCKLEWNWAWPQISRALGETDQPADAADWMAALHTMADAIGRLGPKRLDKLVEVYRHEG